MDVIHQEFRVGFRYPVHFTRGVFSPDNPVLRDVLQTHRSTPAEAVVVLDDGVGRAHPGLADQIEAYIAAHGATLRLAAPVLVVPGGEQSKTDARHLESILHHVHAAGLCRHSYVIVVGGGALLDVGGYAAATAHRGIRLVRVPTTVLAQADSAVGVKNGVNAFGLKNYLGVFAPPAAVINDSVFLRTLENRDWFGGITEAIKVALVKDAAFFDSIEADAAHLAARDAAAMDRLIRHSAALHLSHIAGGDPFESGSSRPLDFGHWAAHKLESLTGGQIRHGEAVGIGIALDSTYAHLSRRLVDRDWRRILDLLRAVRLAIYTPRLESALAQPEHPQSLFRGIGEFREHLGGELTVMMLRGIGRPVDVHAIDTAVMVRAIRLLAEVSRTGMTPTGAFAAADSEART
jgi:3-dehydroquinate synthase